MEESLQDLTDSEPDYDHLAQENELDDLSEPDYDHLGEAFGLTEATGSVENDVNGVINAASAQVSAASDGFGTNNEGQQQEMAYGSEHFDQQHGNDCPVMDGRMEEKQGISSSLDVNGDGDCYYYEVVDDCDLGEEYILGTLMVRVLQAKGLKSNPHQTMGGIGGITNLLKDHRRNRQRSAMSPLSGGGNLTPSSQYGQHHHSSHSNLQQPYAKLSFRGQTQRTSHAMDPSLAPMSCHGEYYWSRGDQSYFDVTCSSYPLWVANRDKWNYRSKVQEKGLEKGQSSDSLKQYVTTASCETSNTSGEKKTHKIQERMPLHPYSQRCLLPPILNLSLYSKCGAKEYDKLHKPSKKTSNQKRYSSSGTNDDEDYDSSNDYFLGKCSINVMRILTGKTPYFDEWVSLHDEDSCEAQNNPQKEAGRVRIVIDYEPSDPPPRPGDMCVFANVFPMVEELYPIPSFTARKDGRNGLHPVRSSMTSLGAASSSSTLSTNPSYGTLSSKLSSQPNHSRHATYPAYPCYQPKLYRVEETLGDTLILSYTSPENWQLTFEIHRFLLLTIHRHQAWCETYKERILDFCDNLSQSPAIDNITHAVERVPEEGLVYVGGEAVGGGVELLGRWWTNGVEGLVEDVVDGMNLDGRYSHLLEDRGSNDDEDEDGGGSTGDEAAADEGNAMEQGRASALEVTLNPEKRALPGMPSCPITGLPMIDPVVAADGHTYERNAIARWLATSNKSPLTGGAMAHRDLVPNYLLLSSLGGDNSGNNDKHGTGEDVKSAS